MLRIVLFTGLPDQQFVNHFLQLAGECRSAHGLFVTLDVGGIERRSHQVDVALDGVSLVCDERRGMAEILGGEGRGRTEFRIRVGYKGVLRDTPFLGRDVR